MNQRKQLKKLGDLIVRTIPQRSFRIDGYTDNQPIKKSKKFSSNKELALARAKSVRDFMVKECGFDKSRFIVHGLGASNPIATNKTLKGRRQNRRVEIVVLRK